MNNLIGPTAKHVWTDAMHGLQTRPLIDPARRPVFTVTVMLPAAAKNQANQG